MKYVKFNYSTPYCGTDEENYCVYDDDITEEELDEILGELIQSHAESFKYLATGWGEDFESDEDRLAYYEDCEGGWVFVSKEEYEDNTRED